ncbi:MAG: NAD-dependent epimerase/dehydratase family protein [Candidatus Rokubacteria bacterium]|nr:NAD-dependent epimerase/dehydratase family protein [Candidatus Rokubacteria bacterium]
MCNGIALVTGGAGFIGLHLVEALVARGCRVRVLDNLSSGRRERLPKGRAVELLVGDLRDPLTLRRATRGVEVVFHQAALRSVPRSIEDPFSYHDVNATGNTSATPRASGSPRASGGPSPRSSPRAESPSHRPATDQPRR